MSEKLLVSFESPQCGWMSMSLEAGGRRFVAAVAHAPYDSLRELIGGLTALLDGGAPPAAFTVSWNREPEEFDLRFEPAGEEVGLEVVRYPDHRRLSREVVFATRRPKAEVCRAFWRELRQLRRRAGVDEFEQNWRRPFPRRELEEFTAALRKVRRGPSTPRRTHAV
jgi:hypothetical protein